jgi:hypothetical protein
MNHLIPILFTLLLAVTVLTVFVGAPQCEYISLVAKASTEEGIERLARYLASHVKGRAKNEDEMWQAYLAPARKLHQAHVEKKCTLCR